MTSVAKRRRNKKRRAQGQNMQQAGLPPKTRTRPAGGSPTARPTPERLKQGVWAEPQGMGKDMQPIVDLASDMIGALYQANQITTSQEQAARLFQQLWAAYLAELGTKGYGSCLADNQAGHDDSDGDPQVIAEYRTLERRIGRVKIACLKLECEKGPRQRPFDIGVLRGALDAVGRA